MITRACLCSILLGVFIGLHAQLPPMQWRNLNYDQGFPALQDGEMLLQDFLGRIWLAYDDGLRCFDGYEVAKYNFDPGDSASLADDEVLGLYEALDHRIWIGSRSQGISIYHPELDLFSHIKPRNQGGPLPVHTIKHFIPDEDGILWITATPGLIRHVPGSNVYDHYEFSEPGITQHGLDYYNTLGDIVFDPLNPDRMFVGSRGGLLEFDKRTNTFQHQDMPWSSIEEIDLDAPEYLVMDLRFLTDQDLWMTTWGGGIMHFNTYSETWERYRDPNAERFRHDIGRRIKVRDSSSFWYASRNGFGLFDILKKTYNYVPVENNEARTLPDYQYYIDFLFTKDSSLLVQGTSGLSIADPYPGYSAGREDYLPMLTGLEVNGVPARLDSHVTFQRAFSFDSDENDIVFKLALPVFYRPEEIQYQFKLSGFDEDWVDNGVSRIRQYTNLKGRNYQLYFRARRGEGPWRYGFTSPAVRIAKPLWQHPLFIAVCVTSVVAILYAFYTLRIRQIKREERLKSEFNQRLADQEMATLRAQMNPHFMFNSLNSIKTYILKQRTDEASTYLTKFSQLMRAVLRNSKSNVVPLGDELHALELYVELEALRFEDEFEYAINCDPDLQTSQVLVPPLLIQPYVENAIRHGLLEKQRGSRFLSVSVRPVQGDQIRITVEDNGVGRAQSERKKKLVTNDKRSYGMQITQDRIELIRKTLGISAEVTVTDLHNEQGDAAGTRVEITIPKISDTQFISHNPATP